MSHVRLAPVLSAILAAATGPASAANWLMLQGTENPKAPDHRLVGFIQPAYTKNLADPMTGLAGPLAANNGKVVAQNLVPPKLEDRSAFHVKRARGGVRGKLGDKFNYFVFVEVAPNNMTYDPFGDRARAIALDHFSITANHIPGARVRAGLFKNPGSEESYQGIATFDYIDFTDFTARENLERFMTGAFTPAASAQGLRIQRRPRLGCTALRQLQARQVGHLIRRQGRAWRGHLDHGRQQVQSRVVPVRIDRVRPAGRERATQERRQGLCLAPTGQARFLQRSHRQGIQTRASGRGIQGRRQAV